MLQLPQVTLICVDGRDDVSNVVKPMKLLSPSKPAKLDHRIKHGTYGATQSFGFHKWAGKQDIADKLNKYE